MKKIAIITGGRTGIGLASVKTFLANDFETINLSRQPANVDGCTDISADFTQDNWHENVFPTLEKKLAGKEQIVVVHNAGMHLSDSALEIDETLLKHSLNVNIIAPAKLNKFLAPYMNKNKTTQSSAIIYIGSTLSEKAVPGCASYVTSKHAVVGMMRATCQDLAGKNIHTACICPGFTDTEMLRKHLGNSQEIIDSISQMTTFGRLIEPQEIANTVFFAATNAVVNGSVIHANLGQIER